MRPDKHLFIVLRCGYIEWRNSMGMSGTDPAATPGQIDQTIGQLRERFSLTWRQIEIRDDRNMT